MITHGSTIGIHAIRPDQVMVLVREAKRRGSFWRLVKGVDNAGLAWDVKRESPETLTITRFVREHDDGAQDIDRWTDAEIEAAAASAIALVFARTSQAEREAADWFEVLNEADPPGDQGWRNLGRLCKRIAELATVRGLHIALPAFNAGTPELSEMRAFIGTGVMKTLAEGGHLLTIHEGVFGVGDPVTKGYGDLLPGAVTVPTDGGSMVGRFRYLYELVPVQERPLCVVSEFYAGGGYSQDGQEPATVVARLAWADRLYRRYPYIVAVLPFTVDPTEGWVHQNYNYAYGAVLDYVVAETGKPNMVGLVNDSSKYQVRRLDPSQGNWDPANYVVDWDWDAVARNEADVIIVRIGDGPNKDPVFDRLRAGLERINKRWGFYHLFRPNVSVTTQLSLIWSWCNVLPPAGVWPDLEVLGGLAPRSAALFEACNSYMLGLDNLYKIICGLYSANWFLQPNFTREQLERWAHRAGWFAGYPNLTVPEAWKDQDPPYVLHQFTDSFMFGGIPRKADANRFYPGLDWRSLVRRQEEETHIMFYVHAHTTDPALAGKLDALVQAAARDIMENGRCLAYGQADPSTPPPPVNWWDAWPSGVFPKHDLEDPEPPRVFTFLDHNGQTYTPAITRTVGYMMHAYERRDNLFRVTENPVASRHWWVRAQDLTPRSP